MNELIYDAIIEHANQNFKTVGKQLFDYLDKISFEISEQSGLNSIHKYAAIDRLDKCQENYMEIYAKKNNIVLVPEQKI